MLLKKTGISFSRKNENLFMYVMKDIAHRGCINSPEYPSPQAFSAWSFLDSTMSCDVTEIEILAQNAFLSSALFQTSRGQRIKRQRLGTRLPNIKDRANWSRDTFQPMRRRACVYQQTNQNIAPVIKNFQNNGRSRTESVIVSRLSGIFLRLFMRHTQFF